MEELYFEPLTNWNAWLQENHHTSKGKLNLFEKVDDLYAKVCSSSPVVSLDPVHRQLSKYSQFII